MSIFSGLKVYPDGWTVIDSRKFDAEELATVGATCEVVEGDWGKSCKWALTNGGGNVFLQMSRDAVANVGDILKTAELTVLTLQRGDEVITRILD